MIVSSAFSGKRYAVLGLARSGTTTVETLLASGAEVIAWDAREEPRGRTARPSRALPTRRPFEGRLGPGSTASSALSGRADLTAIRSPHWTVVARARRRRLPSSATSSFSPAPCAAAAALEAHRGWPPSPAPTASPRRSALLEHILQARGQGYGQDRRQHRRRRSSVWSRHARGRGLRAGAVLLPARPDLQPRRPTWRCC